MSGTRAAFNGRRFSIVLLKCFRVFLEAIDWGSVHCGQIIFGEINNEICNDNNLATIIADNQSSYILAENCSFWLNRKAEGFWKEQNSSGL